MAQCPLLADAEGAEEAVQHLLDIDATGHLAERAEREAHILGGKLGMTLRQGGAGAREAFMGRLEGAAVALAGDDRVSIAGRGGEERRDAVEESAQPGAGLCRDGKVDAGRWRRGEVAFGADPQSRYPRGIPGLSPLSPQSGAASQSTRSACSICARVRETPSISIGSLVSRRPAVSTKVTGNPQRSQRTSMASRVVPGIADTMATSRRAKALRRVDFPAFGGPARTTVKPSRRRSPRPPSARWRAQFSRHVFPQSDGLFLHSSRDVGLVREVERRLEQRQALDQPLAPALDEAAEPPLELAQGLAALRLGLGVDEVGQALDGREVHPAVEEGAAGELARLRRAAARQAGERPQHGGAHC